MRAELRDALSALADGEVADPRLVAKALLEPDAAALIVTLAETRESLRDTTSEPGSGFSNRVERALAMEGRPRFVMIRRFTAPALCAGLGVTAGVLFGALLVQPAAQPAPAIFQPAAAPAVVALPSPSVPFIPVLAVPPPGPRKAAPPLARSVHRFEPGRNWREGSQP